MTIYYSVSLGGFAAEGFGTIPEDAIEITEEQHRALLTAVNSDGKVIEVVAGIPTAVAPPPPTKDQLLAYASVKRRQAETGGITVAGATIDTGRDSQSMITGAYAYSQANPTAVINFKASSGWVVLDATAIAGIATAVGEHVQFCFAAGNTVETEIEAGTITTFAAIDAFAWPSA